MDSIQFLEGMRTRDPEETAAALREIAARDRWLIDGFGSMNVMLERFRLADKVIFVDFPLWRHYWWCTKRQVKSLRAPRAELPAGCDEATLAYTVTLFKILWRVHTVIRPKLVEFFATREMENKIIRVGGLAEWRKVESGDLSL